MLHHHPDTEVLIDYAAGSLAFGQSLCVAVHLESCAQCRARVGSLNTLGAELMNQLEPATIEGSLLDSVLGQLDSASPVRGRPEPAVDTMGVPRALRKLVPAGLDSMPWKRVTPSLQTVMLSVGDSENQVSLIRIKPGGRIAQHRHAGSETTVVLRGGFSDNGGNFLSGDFVTLGKEDTHRPIAHQDQDCICLAAQNAPLQFTGFWSKMVNPFMSIQPG
jgi:putative transcriptional regulator